jgi:hypothetical protein
MVNLTLMDVYLRKLWIVETHSQEPRQPWFLLHRVVVTPTTSDQEGFMQDRTHNQVSYTDLDVCIFTNSKMSICLLAFGHRKVP